MTDSATRIPVEGSGSVSAIWTNAPDASAIFAYAPGAGSDLKDPFGAFAAEALAEHGISCLRFQFPYREAGRSAPDRTPVLESTWRSAIALARAKGGRLIVGGRSMGGRIASQVVARDGGVEGLALFAYPLHPAGRPEQRRDGHLATISVPVLLCSGDRDSYTSIGELKELASLIPGARLHVLAGADHGFSMLKASGRRREDVWREAVQQLVDFIEQDVG